MREIRIFNMIEFGQITNNNCWDFKNVSSGTLKNSIGEPHFCYFNHLMSFKLYPVIPKYWNGKRFVEDCFTANIAIIIIQQLEFLIKVIRKKIKVNKKKCISVKTFTTNSFFWSGASPALESHSCWEIWIKSILKRMKKSF